MRRSGLAAAMLLAAGALPACTMSDLQAVSCVPVLAVTPDEAHPGDTVVVETRVPCAARPPADGWLIEVHPVGRPSYNVRTSIVPERDGSFTVSLPLPKTMPFGEAVASIANWDYSRCDDGGGSCASASADFTVIAD